MLCYASLCFLVKVVGIHLQLVLCLFYPFIHEVQRNCCVAPSTHYYKCIQQILRDCGVRSYKIVQILRNFHNGQFPFKRSLNNILQIGYKVVTTRIKYEKQWLRFQRNTNRDNGNLFNSHSPPTSSKESATMITTKNKLPRRTGSNRS